MNILKKQQIGYDLFDIKIDDIIRRWLIGEKPHENEVIIAATKADKSKSLGKCPVCMEDHGRIVLSCGHSCCIECLVELPSGRCYICPKKITYGCLLY